MSANSNTITAPTAGVMSTMQADGRRRWLQPRLAVGRFFKQRRTVAYLLIALLTVLPFITINGKPSVLLDLPARKFTFFGYTFLPTDTALLALLMLAWFASILLVTAIAGRAWCGWTCPQTVYLEFVYRPLERLCLGRSGVGGKVKANISVWRYVLMYALFAIVSLIVTHTLLSYFVGVEQLRHWVVGNPLNHPAAFILIAVSSAAVFYNFAFYREQMCTIACPYGRLQSVMLDRHSMAVRYDVARGEPRTKGKRTPLNVLNTAQKSIGDCVDCLMCMQVCPTGIDIRNGLQLECINCLQCVDACDAVMTKVGLPTGLIAVRSEASLERQPTQHLRPRVILYAALTFVFAALVVGLIVTKRPFDATLVRNGGLPFVVTPEGIVENTMRLTLRNRTDADQTITLVVATEGVRVSNREQSIHVPAGQTVEQPIHLMAESSSFGTGKRAAELRLIDQTGATRTLTCQIFGPGALQ